MRARRRRPGPRDFDPVRLGELESAAWSAYYRRAWRPFLTSSLGLVSTGFGTGPVRTVRGAWWVLRANQVWAPYPDNDPDRARFFMQRFYAMVAGDAGIDAREAARREVEWWRVHRVHQREDGVTEHDLVHAVAQLYAYVYDAAITEVREAARLRVLAMRHCDEWVAAGRAHTDPLLTDVRRALVASYTALRAAVGTGESSDFAVS